MKRTLMILLSLLMFGLLIGCSNKKNTDNANKTTINESTKILTDLTEDGSNVLVESSLENEYIIKGKESKISTVVNIHEKMIENAEIEYRSLNEDVASVDINGNVKGLSYGKTTIESIYKRNGKEYKNEIDVFVLEKVSAVDVNSFSANYVNTFGRTYKTGDSLILDNPGTALEVWFFGTSLTINEKGSSQSLYFRVFVDNDTEGVMTSASSTKNTDITVCSNLEEGIHSVRIVKSSSPDNGKIFINSVSTDGDFLKAKPKSDLKIEFIGDSITVGFGNLGDASSTQSTKNSDTTKGYAYLTAQGLNADYSIIALEGICITDTQLNMKTYYEDYSTTNKTEYNPSLFDADIVVVAMGENDMWHATDKQFSYSVEQFISDYSELLKTVRSYHENAYIVCIFGMMPASSTTQAKESIRSAIEQSGVTNIKMIQMSCNTSGSGQHPNRKGHTAYSKKLITDIERNCLKTE